MCTQKVNKGLWQIEKHIPWPVAPFRGWWRDIESNNLAFKSLEAKYGPPSYCALLERQ